MPLAQLSFFARSLGMQSDCNVLLPDSPDTQRFPVLYLLHGLSDDHSIWLRRTLLERYAAPLPLIIVLPNGHRGWYTNAASPPGRPYEDTLLNDLIPLIDRTFPTLPTRESRVIAGLSMGGYGAVKLALKHPHLFSAAAAHSAPLLTPMHEPEKRPEKYQPALIEFEAIFGPNWKDGPNDPAHLAKTCPQNLRPALHIDCGLSDFLIDQNRQFHTHLNSLNFPHTYLEHPGEHNWTYWDTHIQDALKFFAAHLNLPVPT